MTILNHQFKTGLSFGLTSGIITTLGLMVGLNSTTHSKEVVIGGILVIALADSLSDALGIHMSEESEAIHSPQEIWQSSFFTFLAKLVFALSFLAPLLIFPLATAVIVSVGWGIMLLAFFSFYLAQIQKQNPLKVILGHLFIALVVILLTHLIGSQIRALFGSS